VGPHRDRVAAEGGFSLIEALVALGIVATVVISYIGIRTSALVDATQARNWRLAREIAEEKLSELKAGAREVAPVSGETQRLEKYEGFSYKILIGEANVSDAESEVGAAAAGEDEIASERIEWQRDRENYRRASSRGQTAQEYDEQRLEDVNQRLAEKAPSETDFEEVAVVVYFPKLDFDYEGQQDALMIKARLSTLAISGLTPEQAQTIAQSMGQAGEGAGATPGGSGASGGNGAASAGNNGGR
jgi:Tfp pilus assembly protein PilV